MTKQKPPAVSCRGSLFQIVKAVRRSGSEGARDVDSAVVDALRADRVHAARLTAGDDTTSQTVGEEARGARHDAAVEEFSRKGQVLDGHPRGAGADLGERSVQATIGDGVLAVGVHGS